MQPNEQERKHKCSEVRTRTTKIKIDFCQEKHLRSNVSDTFVVFSQSYDISSISFPVFPDSGKREVSSCRHVGHTSCARLLSLKQSEKVPRRHRDLEFRGRASVRRIQNFGCGKGTCQQNNRYLFNNEKYISEIITRFIYIISRYTV